MPSKRPLNAGRATITLSLKDSRLQKGLFRASAALKKMGGRLKKIGKIGAAAGAAITAPFIVATRHFSKAGDEVQKMGARTGASAEFLSALGFAAEQSGTNLGDIEKSLRRTAATVRDAGLGLTTATDALDDLGISFEELQGLSLEQQFMAIADALNNIESASEKSAIAQRVFGRSGTFLLPMLGNYRELMEEARRLGLVMSQDDANAAAALTDAMNRLWRQVKMVTFHVGAAVAESLTPLLKQTVPIVRGVIEWTKANGPLVRSVLSLGLALSGLSSVILGLGVGLAIMGGALAALANPFILIGGLIVTGIGAFAAFTDAGRDMVNLLGRFFGRLGQKFGMVIEGMKDAMLAGDIKLAAEVLFAGLNVAFTEGFNKLRGMVTDFFRDLVTFIADTGLFIGGASGLVPNAQQVRDALKVDVQNAKLTAARGRQEELERAMKKFEDSTGKASSAADEFRKEQDLAAGKLRNTFGFNLPSRTGGSSVGRIASILDATNATQILDRGRREAEKVQEQQLLQQTKAAEHLGTLVRRSFNPLGIPVF